MREKLEVLNVVIEVKGEQWTQRIWGIGKPSICNVCHKPLDPKKQCLYVEEINKPERTIDRYQFCSKECLDQSLRGAKE